MPSPKAPAKASATAAPKRRASKRPATPGRQHPVDATGHPDETAAHSDTDLRAPGLLMLALETRAPWELGASLLSLPILSFAPRGDGHAVLVFPGLAAPDVSTWPLRNFLAARGYSVHGWELGFNWGPRAGVIEASLKRVHELSEATGGKVSLVGWSLGGVYAREIAKLAHDRVRNVITLGTPFTGHPRATNAWRLYEFASGQKLNDLQRLAAVRQAPRVPTTSIYSRTDGVVNWRCSHEHAPHAENIEVVASHFGIGLNPAVWYAVADRLAQNEGQWQPFHREGWRGLIYPKRNPAAKNK